MARLLIWSRRAIEDLEAIAQYIAQDSEVYASSVVRDILKKPTVLPDFPFVGRIVPEFSDESIREIFAYNYRIIYKIEHEAIIVAAVIHGKRLLEMDLRP